MSNFHSSSFLPKGGGGTDYVKVTTGVPLGRVLFEIQKALAKGMILIICPSEGYTFENLP